MNTDFILRRAAQAYNENNGVLPLDMIMALTNAGLLVEDVIIFLEEEKA